MLAFDANLYITGEYVLHISQNMMVAEGTREEDIKIITSHPQAIGQCAQLISEKFPNAKIEFADSTSAAAKRVASGEKGVACIASPNSAKLYGLEMIYPDCGDDHNNSTRFVILEKSPSMKVSDHDKTSIAFTLEDKPGSLYNALELFSASKLNLKKIESRPMKNELGKYMFFIDIDGNIDNATIYFALDKLRSNTLFYKFLGSYRYEK
jgi:prephenate dehydratase